MWPALRQISERDSTALGETAMSARSRELTPRTRSAGRVVRSICPYCAVGCGQLVYVKDERIIDMVAERVKNTRDQTWETAAPKSGHLGSLALRFAVFQAGKVSARDPRATFRQQRAGFGAAEVTGQAAVAGPENVGQAKQMPVPRSKEEIGEYRN